MFYDFLIPYRGKLLIFLLFTFTAGYINARYLIYSEDFSGQNGKGAYGPIPTMELSEVDWTLDITNASLSASDDYAKIVNEAFEFHDTDGVVSFESPFVNATGFTNFYLEFEASEVGDLEGTDLLEAFYSVDGGTTHQSIASRSANFSDDNVSDALSVALDDVSASIAIKIEGTANAAGEYLRFDNLGVRSGTLNGSLLEVNSSSLNRFNGAFEIYAGELYLDDQTEFSQDLSLSSNFLSLYQESFASASGKGITGTAFDLAGVEWNVSAPGTLVDQFDYMQVIVLSGNEIFEFRDLGAASGSWTSPDINVSGYQSLSFSMELSEVGTMESDDQIDVSYSFDNGQTYTSISSKVGEFTSQSLSYDLDEGDLLKIRVSAKNSADDEKHRFDDLIVQGLAKAIIGERKGGESEFSGSLALNRPTHLTAAENGRVTISGMLSGNATVTKEGMGIVSITDPTSSHSGDYLIEQGKIEIGSGVSLSGTASGSGSEKSVIGGNGTIGSANIGSSSSKVKFISPGLGHASSPSCAASLVQSISLNDNGTQEDSSDDASASIGSLSVTTLGLDDGGVYDWEI